MKQQALSKREILRVARDALVSSQFLPGGLDRMTLDALEVVDASRGHVQCRMRVEERHANGIHTLHGGAIGILMDVVTSLAVLTVDGERVGVSTDLNISYLSSAKVNETVIVEAWCGKKGATLAFVTAEIRCDDRIIALGRVTKHITVATVIEQRVDTKARL